MLGTDVRPDPVAEEIAVLGARRAFEQPREHIGDRSRVGEGVPVFAGAGGAYSASSPRISPAVSPVSAAR